MTAGSPLHCETSGEGTPLVLLHEGASSGRDWDSFVPLLAEGGRQVLTYDRRGFGRSPRDTGYGQDLFREDVADLVALLAEQAAGPAHLVGHSDGGTVALLAAALHPELVLSVTAVATHVRPDPETVAAVRALGSPAQWDPAVGSSYRRRHGDDWEQVVGAWLRFWTDASCTTWDLSGELPAVRCPVLVVHDRRDPLSAPLHAEAIAAALPHAQVSWYETDDHRPHRRERERFLRELAAHLAAAEGAAS